MNNVAFQIYGSKRNSLNARWDTKSYVPVNNAFDVRRSTDNVTQTFNYTQLIDGTYDTFLTGGATGYISKWYGDNYNLTNCLNKIIKIKINSNLLTFTNILKYHQK